MMNQYRKPDMIKTENIDDEYWVSRMTFDPNAFEAIYNRYLPRLTRYFTRRVGNETVAEDLTANVFLNALQGIQNGRYTPKQKFAAWLFSIARARVIDYYRERKSISFKEVEKDILEKQYREPVSKISADLSACIYELSDFEQELLTLRFSADLEFNDIAAILNKSPGAVKMATYRALLKLRNKMEVLDE